MASDSAPETDPYLASLLEQKKELERREETVDRQDQAIRAEREAIARELVEWRAAVNHYQKHLSRLGRRAEIAPSSWNFGNGLALNKSTVEQDAPAGDESDSGAPSIPGNVSLRAGKKRRAILEAVARASSGGRLTCNRDITRATGFPSTHISSVVYNDIQRGLIERVDDQIRMTPTGFEFLRQIGSPARDAEENDKKEAPVSPL